MSVSKEIIAEICNVKTDRVACKNCKRFNLAADPWCNGFDTETKPDNYCAWFEVQKNGKAD